MRRDDVIDTLRAHQREVNELGIQRVAVFGSVARGEDSEESDLDLVVAFADPPRHSLLDVVRVQRTLSDWLGTDVDLAVEPLQSERFRSRVEQDLVRAFWRSRPPPGGPAHEHCADRAVRRRPRRGWPHSSVDLN